MDRMNSFPGKARNPYEEYQHSCNESRYWSCDTNIEHDFLRGNCSFCPDHFPELPKFTTPESVGNGIKYGSVASTAMIPSRK